MEYSLASFDVILSVDTIYFIGDMKAFIQQVYGWLKPGGILAVMYGCYGNTDNNIH